MRLRHPVRAIHVSVATIRHKRSVDSTISQRAYISECASTYLQARKYIYLYVHMRFSLYVHTSWGDRGNVVQIESERTGFGENELYMCVRVFMCTFWYMSVCVYKV